MIKAAWTRTAERQLEGYFDRLAQDVPELPPQARRDVYAIADQTARRPQLARATAWDGLFARSVRRWRKLLIFNIEGATVRVVAFYDMRQDLSAVDPFSE